MERPSSWSRCPPDMLRLAVLVLGIALLTAGVIAIGSGTPGLSLWLLVVGGVITAGTVFERVLYKPLLGKKPGPGWVKTTERFVDPDSGKTVDVFYEPSSGERQYVSQDPETASKSR
jgi:hypothetical protein